MYSLIFELYPYLPQHPPAMASGRPLRLLQRQIFPLELREVPTGHAGVRLEMCQKNGISAMPM